MKKYFLEIFTFFKMAAIFGPKLEILAILLYKNGCHFEKSEIFEKNYLHFFCPYQYSDLAEFQVQRTSTAKVDPENVILR